MISHPSRDFPAITAQPSGTRVNAARISPKDIHIGDVALALSHICRFGGHVRNFYSVAEHSLLVAHMARTRGLDHQTQLYALLHDAHEAYTGDLATPHKNEVGGWYDFEDFAQTAVLRALMPKVRALGSDTLRQVKELDILALHYEARELQQVRAAWVDDKIADLARDMIPERLRALGLNSPSFHRQSFLIAYDSLQ